MPKRTTVELDEDLLGRARRALGTTTMRATITEALRRAVDEAEDEAAERRRKQLDALTELARRVDAEVLLSEEMWR